MEQDYYDEFILYIHDGYIHLKIEEVFDFPDKTCFSGGYDTKSFIVIESQHYSASGEIYISTGQLYTFYIQLQECYQTLKGTANLNSTENNLQLSTNFDGFGHVTILGSLKFRHDQENELKFELFTDQTTIFQAISGLSSINEKYGGMEGFRKQV